MSDGNAITAASGISKKTGSGKVMNRLTMASATQMAMTASSTVPTYSSTLSMMSVERSFRSTFAKNFSGKTRLTKAEVLLMIPISDPRLHAFNHPNEPDEQEG